MKCSVVSPKKRNRNRKKITTKNPAKLPSIHLEGKKKVGSSTKERWEMLLLLYVHTLMSRMKRATQWYGISFSVWCWKLTQIEGGRPSKKKKSTVEVDVRPKNRPHPARHRIDFGIDFHLIDESSSTLWSSPSIPPHLL